jgi:hypothetical protein
VSALVVEIVQHQTILDEALDDRIAPASGNGLFRDLIGIGNRELDVICVSYTGQSRAAHPFAGVRAYLSFFFFFFGLADGFVTTARSTLCIRGEMYPPPSISAPVSVAPVFTKSRREVVGTPLVSVSDWTF